MSIQNLIMSGPYWIRQIGLNTMGFVLSRRRFSKDFWKFFNEFDKNLDKSKQTIAEEQLLLLKNNLINSFENIPYYNRIFKEVGFNPYDFKEVSELNVIPFLTKDIIREEFENLYNPLIDKSRYVTHSTSGSTGAKLKFLMPKKLLYTKNMALTYRFYKMAGVKPYDKRVTIGGRKFSNKKPFWGVNYFENQLLISAHDLREDLIPEYLIKMQKFEPIYIQGHPSAILILANFILGNNHNNLNLNLKAIFTTGETLTAFDKNTIEQAFKTKLYQQYGSGEGCFSCQEAPGNDGYLINYEHGFIELIGDEKQKEVVVTSLQNDVMPFIRYKMGDFVVPVHPQYSTNFGLPILFSEVIGRIDDILDKSDGGQVLPVTIRMNMKPLLTSGCNYQIIQISLDNFKVKLVDPHKQLEIVTIKSLLFKLLGNNINLTIDYVDTLTSDGGKVRNVIKLKK